MTTVSVQGHKVEANPIDAARIRVFDHLHADASARDWDEYVKRHPEGTVFHLAAWQRFIESSFPHVPQHLAALDSDNKIVGLLPLFSVRSRIFGRMLVSTPQAAYGGILADTEKVRNDLLLRAQEMAVERKVRFLELRNRSVCLNDPSLATKDLYVTFRGSLSDDPEKVFLSIPRKTRAEAREGIKNGLEFRLGDVDIDSFYSVYSRNVRDLGTPVFSRKMFANGPREFGQDCRIASVHWNGKIIAAVWTLFYKDEVVPYYGGSIRDYNHLGSNNFMYWMLMKYGCENGFRIYDFGRSKKGTGSFDFKKRWGMVMTDLPYQYHLLGDRTMPDTSPLNAKFSLSIRLWRKLPLPVANVLGPIISSHLI
jgi:FemAB-related protein (PEP-CTERM system-associated)